MRRSPVALRAIASGSIAETAAIPFPTFGSFFLAVADVPTSIKADKVIAKPLYSENVCVIFLSNSIIAKIQKSIVHITLLTLFLSTMLLYGAFLSLKEPLYVQENNLWS